MGQGLDFLAGGMEQMRAAGDIEERWRVAHAMLAELGCTAMNAGAVRTGPFEITYMRSSMSQDWLEEYTAQGYIEVDPFVDKVRPGMSVAPGSSLILTDRARDARRKGVALHSNMSAAGYRMAFGAPFDSDRPGERRLVTLFSDLTDARHWTPEVQQRLQCFSLLANAFLFQRDDRAEGGAEAILSGRERDVLLLLATGLKNQRIAERLGVAEITVRMHMAAARRKLGARTREQAVAIAVRDSLIRP